MNIINYLDDDGNLIEPKYYLPVIPMILVNGTQGIGTGFSTKVPSFNPLDIIKNIKRLLDGKDTVVMHPWYRGFKGQIQKVEDKKYVAIGNYNLLNKNTINITELPIGEWTQNYKNYLEEIIIDTTKEGAKKGKKNILTTYTNKSSDINIDFHLKIPEDKLNTLLCNEDKFMEIFKLKSSISLTNMYLHDVNNKLKKYDSAEEILKEYYEIRLEYYIKRKEYLLAKYKKELDIISAKVIFINGFIKGDIQIINKEDEEVEQDLIKLNLKKMSPNEKDQPSYDYLLNLKIRTLTKKQLDELNKQKDAKQEVYNDLFNKSIETLWRDDLKNLEDKYKEIQKEYNAKFKEKVKSI